MHTIPAWETYSLLSLHYVVLLLVVRAFVRGGAQLNSGKLLFLWVYFIAAVIFLSWVIVSAKDPGMVIALMMIPAIVFVLFLMKTLFYEVKNQVDENQHR